jgi:DNA-binding NtrC family response regulator
MKIIIVENELYLAQSIQNNLTEKLKATCEIYGSYSEAANKEADVYIINTTLKGNVNNFIQERKDKIIILLVPYVTHSNVTEPLNKGADDYLQKPFTIEELIRKIKHLKEYYTFKEQVKRLNEFIEFILRDIEIDFQEYKFPLFIKSSPTKAVEKFIYEISKKEQKPIEIIDLNNKKNLKKKLNKNTIYLFLNYDKIDANSDFAKEILNYNSIILLPKNSSMPNCIEIEANSKLFFEEEILSIEEYIKFIITTHQKNLPDTELSKRLGISRKSLWEKRKKYGIFKQK